MPALILFKRRWQVGGDDLVFPAIASVSVRLIFLAAAVTVFATEHPSIRECMQGYLLGGFLIGLAVLLSVTIVLETAIGVVSGRGTITGTHARRWLPTLLYIRAAVFIAEIASSIVGAVWVFQDWEFDPSTDTCDVSLVRLVQAALVFSWLLLVSIATAIIILFGGKPHNDREQFDDYERWEKRCRTCCFFERKDENSHIAYAEAAAVFSSLFQGLDIVLSDIVAGLILVQVEQERRIEEGVSNTARCLNPGPEVPIPTDPVESQLETIWHFYHFSMASNGWPVLVQAEPCCCLFKLCAAGTYCCCGKRPDHVQGDNCCQCNTSAIRAIAGADEEDLVYVSFENRIFQSPFYVVVDHDHRSVVIAIRGTLSFKDMLTDVAADAERLDLDGREIYGHRGIVNNSKYILGKLQELQLLQKAFQNFPDYQLVVTGHSLGAGVAAILSILLRDQYPNIKAYAFAPPGGLINAEGVLYTQDFVTSVVLGEDVVPRMSMCNLKHIRDQLVDVTRACQVPKYRVLLRGLWYSCSGLPKKLPVDNGEFDHDDGCCNPREPLLPIRGATRSASGSLLAGTCTPPEETPYDEGNGHMTGGAAASNEVSIECPSATGPSPVARGPKEYMDLFPPGQMIWITRREVPSGGCCGRKEEYDVRWVTHHQFDHIGVRPGMIKDHLPLDIGAALSWLVDQTRANDGHAPLSSS